MRRCSHPPHVPYICWKLDLWTQNRIQHVEYAVTVTMILNCAKVEGCVKSSERVDNFTHMHGDLSETEIRNQHQKGYHRRWEFENLAVTDRSIASGGGAWRPAQASQVKTRVNY